MSKFFKKFVFLVITVMISLIILVTQSSLYNQVHVIDDKELVMTKATESIPVKITLENSIWGGIEVEDEFHLQNIVSLFDQIIENGKATKSLHAKKIQFKGNIFYSNGSKRRFIISDTLTVDERVYNSEQIKPIISALKSNLLELYYTPTKIGSLVEKSIYVTTILDNKKVKKINKKALSHYIKSSSVISDYQEIVNFLSNEKRALAFINIYLKDHKREGIISIAVYSKFFIVQYLGDDKGNVVYMKGSLKDVMWGGIKS
ncbi:DUF3919 family protein [Bacillus sp. CLL-7-23]|uniref:DUF3919 family protein n=1 Tax=Bacillus changyiensis TaxID=3004103 RepID=A0ABT4X4Y0_9BACI|nr:DUF3919 family protein [Bacillus changyiensis]MDA7026422.1 DUF3919 family protein [Bacillus changyiensis]